MRCPESVHLHAPCRVYSSDGRHHCAIGPGHKPPHHCRCGTTWREVPNAT